jgi:hypothetical protein
MDIPKGYYPDITKAPRKYLEAWLRYCKHKLENDPGIAKHILQEIEVKMKLERARRILK